MDKQQQIEQLRAKGLSYRVIANRVGLSLSAVYERLNPAKKLERQRQYQQTPRSKEYQRRYHFHYNHLRTGKRFKYCEKCVAMGKSKIGLEKRKSYSKAGK